MMKMGTVALVVKDGPAAMAWYRDKLGFEVKAQEGHWITVAPPGADTAFHLCAGFHPLEPGNSGISFLTEDLSAEESALRTKGVEFKKGKTTEDWGTYAILADPDGNEFWLMEE